MIPEGIARVRACFEDMIEVFPIGDPRNKEEDSPTAQSISLPQMPQMPLHQAPACRALTDQEDAAEERAAIMEYDGGIPRFLAEFLAGRCRDVTGRAAI
jgi:hypothetical protein